MADKSSTITPRQNTFKFVYFDGQNEALEGNNPIGKKRKKPRPITSCQTCRRRKIKCLNNLLPCEACIESGEHCSLLDPPPDSNFPTDTSASGSSSFSSKLQPSSSNGSSHQPRPPAPPASSSSSFSSAPAPAQQPSYSPTTQDSHQPNRSSSSTSATVSKSRSPPPPRHDSHDLSFSSNSNKRARHSLPNPITNTTNTLPSFQTYQPPLTYSSSSSSTSTAEPRPAPPPASSSSRPSQAAPVPAPPPPHHNSIAFLLHPWSPANDEFGPGRIRGAKVEPLPVGVPVGLGVEAVGKKDAAGVLFKVPAVPLGRGGKQQQGVASSSSSGSNPNTTASPTTNTPLASTSTSSHPPHHHHHPTAQPLNGTASVSPNPNSIPSTSPFDASFNDRPSSSDLQDLKRTCLAPLSFLFPWIPSRISSSGGQVEVEGEGEGEKVAGAVDLAVASWGARISSGGSSSKGKQTARRYLERAKGMSVSGEMGVQELEDVLMVAWSEYGSSGPKTSWLLCSLAARMVETILLENQTGQGTSGSGTSPSSSTSNSTTSHSHSHSRSSSSLSPVNTSNPPHSSASSPLPAHLHLSLFQLSTLLSLCLPIHSHLHVPPPPAPSLPLPPQHSPFSSLTLSLHQAWSSLLDLLHQIALLLRGGGAGRESLQELMQLGFELYGHLGEKGGVLDPLGGKEGAEGRLVLEVWMLGVFVFLNTPSLLPQHLQPSPSSSARNIHGTTNGYSPSSRSTAVPSSFPSDPSSSSSSSSVALSSATKLTTHLQLASSGPSLAQTLPFLDTPIRWAMHVLEREISEQGGGVGGGTGPGAMVGMILIGEMKECVGVCREFLSER
ncbi:hypothetical protein BDY24DRAFT_404841 [Mrakia frigida]|uniref:Zn(II)2Cys6 transcription factor domain-containing protein n=1 Tax=Mrakia frigida TaxID=29902 RepID=UPI003FCC0067